MHPTLGKHRWEVVVIGRRLLAACAFALAFFAGLLLAACGSSGEAAPSPQPTFSTARETVVAFYEAHAEGREAAAYALLSNVHEPDLTLDQYVGETRWRRDLELQDVGPAEAMSSAGFPEHYERLYDLRQIEVEFYQALDAAAREGGQATEWVTVARETPEGPWRIIEIGTGP
jgi:hypothetical protein